MLKIKVEIECLVIFKKKILIPQYTLSMSITIPQAPYQWQPNDVWEGIDVAHLHHNTCIAKKNQHQ
jgi:hypothetical protein